MRQHTLTAIFDRVIARPRPALLRFKHEGAWREISSAEFGARVRALASYLDSVSVAPGDRIAIFSENRPEWTISDFACQCLGAVDVPIYGSLSAEQIGYLLRDSGARLALASTRSFFERVVLAAQLGGRLERIILFDRWPDFPPPAGPRPDFAFEGDGTSGQFRVLFENWVVVAPADEPLQPAGPPAGSIDVVFLEEALRRGEALDRRDPERFERRKGEVRPADLASIIYTSGTTGPPKGVMLAHTNFCSNVDACLSLIPFDGRDLALSFLPLSHVFERTIEYCYLAAGGAIAYAVSFDTVGADILEVRPTVFGSVPRLFEKIHARIVEGARSGGRAKRRLFDWAVAAGRERTQLLLARRKVPLLVALKFRIADRLVFSKIKGRLGGRVRFLVSGGAPLGRELAEFFLAAGITVLEGYGLTETSPVIALNTPGALRPGTVGKILPGVEVRIADDGEILVRGPNVMQGYFGRPEETREAIRYGWFATGDIGRLDEDGYLLITDRKKDLLITSGGKNVAPQPIENALRASRYIASAVLVGDRRNFISALIVPDFEALARAGAERGFGDLPPGELVRRPEVLDLIATEIDAATSGLASYEKVKRFTLLEHDLTIDAGELTPTFKVRRRIVAERYRAEIEAMYS